MSYKIDEQLRDELKHPLGYLINDNNVGSRLKELKGRVIISVGDRTTERLEELGLNPKVEIVDGMEKRKSRALPGNDIDIKIIVKNPQGTITASSVEAIKCAIRTDKRTRIIVEGEEDLLAIPCIIHSKSGWIIAYGQPNEGMVIVEVGNSIKRLARSYLKRMQQ
ncbi:MAG: GTP-dependent dephospho-CoA kinase family protein [Nitrososphaeria archaeon]